MSTSFFQTMALEQGLTDRNRERLTRVADSVRASLLPHQLAVLEDPAKNKSAICPRRAGKSWTAMSYCFDVCLRNPGAHVVIVTLTLKSAKNIYWNEIRNFAKRFGIEIETFKNEMLIEFPEGSQMFMIGAESKAQIEKLRGGKYDLVVVDECKSYPPAIMKELIEDCVEPALMDRDGTILLIGTPGNILSGIFFEATFPGHVKSDDGEETDRPTSRTYGKPEKYWISHPEEDDWEWSRHSWTLKDNTAAPNAWKRALRNKKKRRWDDNHPTWRREYLGEWVASEAAFVYSYASLTNTDPWKVNWEPDFVDGNVFGLDKSQEWRYIIGIDLGFEDDFAIVIGAYSPFDGVLYQAWEFKEPGLDVFDCAEKVMYAVSLCEKVDKIIADTGGLGKQIIETLRRRYGLSIEAADKREKLDFIELLNGDYHAGRVKLIKGGELAFENQALQWDLGESSKQHLARTGRLKEHPSCPNHLCDAWLYLWRFSYHYWYEDRTVSEEPGTIAYERKQNAAAMKQLVSQRSQQLNDSFFDNLKKQSVDPLKEIDSLWN